MQALTTARARAIATWSVLLSLPAFAAPFVGAETSALHRVVDPANPWFSGESPFLVYAAMPVTVFACIVLVLAPGLLLALALGRARSPSEWILAGFALSVVVVSVAAAAVQAALGAPLTGAAFVATVLGCALLAWLALELRLLRGSAPNWPIAEGGVPAFFAVHAAMPLVFLVCLTPKFFWESFNGDGAHTLESTRLLLRQNVPLWPENSGGAGYWPGVNTMLFIYPESWFLRLFGEVEAAVRLPVLLFLVVLHAGVLALVRDEPGRALGAWSHALVMAGVAGVALVLATSGTYDPYSADVALPATQDALLVACLLGMVTGHLRRDVPWTFVFALLTFSCSPGGPLLLVVWGVAILVGWRRRPWREIATYGGVVAACCAFGVLLPSVLAAAGAHLPGREHAPTSLLRKFRYVSPFEFQRLAYLVVPAGIYPALALFAWRRADDAARALTVATALAFGAYYVMAFMSLHYFVPAMVLTLVVFWRVWRPDEWRAPRVALALCSASAALSIWFALPVGPSIHTATREVGERLDASGVPGYSESAAEAFEALPTLLGLFAPDSDPEVPGRLYGGSPIAWNYYARRSAAGPERKNYFLLRASSPPPPGTTLVRTRGPHSVYVRDPDVWESHRTMHPAGSGGRALYAIPTDVLFGREPPTRPGIVDLREIVERFRRRGE